MELLNKLDLEKLKNYPHKLDILLGIIVNEVGAEDFFIKIEKEKVFAITNHKSSLLPAFFTVTDILNNLNYSNINQTISYSVKKDLVLKTDIIYRVAIHKVKEEEYTIALRCYSPLVNNLKNSIEFSDSFLEQYHYLKNYLETNLINKSTITNKLNKL